MMRCTLISVLIVLFFVSWGPAQTRGEEWKSLFNGKDLTGWEVVGGGLWSVENGEIAARRERGTTSGGWLISREDYGNYKLRFKFQMVIEGGNSGILIRDPGHAKIGRPAFNGYEMQIYEGGSGTRNTTGAIYDVARSYPKKMKKDEWTEFEIHCIGDHIVTFMDGEKMAETHNRRSFEGAIGLQLHGGSEPAHLRWKDVEILELPDVPNDWQFTEEKMEQAAGEYANLFEGKTLDEDFEFYWRSGAKWTLENEILKGEYPEKNSWIFLKESYSDYILSFDVLISKGGNAGICFRFPQPEDGSTEKGPAFLGYECQILDADEFRDVNVSGSIYDIALAYPTDQYKRPIFRSGKWNHYKIYAMGDHIITYVNGKKTAECHSERSLSGRIGFQVHHPAIWVEYKNVRIKIITKPL